MRYPAARKRQAAALARASSARPRNRSTRACRRLGWRPTALECCAACARERLRRERSCCRLAGGVRGGCAPCRIPMKEVAVVLAQRAVPARVENAAEPCACTAELVRVQMQRPLSRTPLLQSWMFVVLVARAPNERHILFRCLALHDARVGRRGDLSGRPQLPPISTEPRIYAAEHAPAAFPVVASALVFERTFVAHALSRVLLWLAIRLCSCRLYLDYADKSQRAALAQHRRPRIVVLA